MTESLSHTNKLNECFITEINRIVEICDNEYYMSALGPPLGTLVRAKRGRARIMEAIAQLQKIRQTAICLVCLKEIESQIQKQENGLLEIESVWNI